MASEQPDGLLSVILLTKDEEVNLPYALESFRDLDVRFFVVDSGSFDGTVDLARSYGCTVAERPFRGYGEQMNWAIANNPHKTAWVMRMDADETLTTDLREELKVILPALIGKCEGLIVRRRVYFWGRWIRHGGYYPTYLLRIWRHGTAHCESREMDEHMVLNVSGNTTVLSHDIIDENHKGLTFWTDKHNGYADREVRDLVRLEGGTMTSGAHTGQAKARRWIKERLYSRSPLFLRAWAYWLYRYVIRLGFLDGIPGLVFHFLQGFWYRFLVDAKLYEHRLREMRQSSVKHRT